MQLGGRQSHGGAADTEDRGDLRHGLDQAKGLLQASAIVDKAIEFCNHRVSVVFGSWGAGVERKCELTSDCAARLKILLIKPIRGAP